MTSQRRASSLSPTPRPATEALKEHDRVALAEPVPAAERILPEGASGTIVSVWDPGTAYEVEFTQPFAAIVTLRRQQVTPVAIRDA